MPDRPSQSDFPDSFITYAKKRMAEDGEFLRHEARFGPLLLQAWAEMIIIASGEKIDM